MASSPSLLTLLPLPHPSPHSSSKPSPPSPNPPPWLPPPHHPPLLRHLLLSSSSSSSAMGDLRQLHAHAVVSGAMGDPSVASRLISLAADASLPYALSILAQTPSPDPFALNALLRAHALRPDPFGALRFYTDALRSPAAAEFSFPNPRTFPIILKACSLAPALRFGEMVHAQVVKVGLGSAASVQNFLVYMYASCGRIELARIAFDAISELNAASMNMMLDAYVKCGHLGDARKVFDEMPERDVLCWSVLINGYVQDSHFKEGLVLFRAMLGENKEPNESILVNVLSACAHLGAIEQGMWVEGYVKKKSIRLSVRLGTALLDMYLKCGCVEKAFEVFRTMEERNVTTWSAMIGGLAVNGQAKDALGLFSQMEFDGIIPNEVTFVGVLNSCSHSGLVEEGEKYFNSMTSLYGIKPNIHHYCCLVDLYGRAGLLDKAEKVIKKTPMKANSAVWGALLNSCKIHGNAVLGERVGKKLLELDPTNSGRYVLLSNIYAVNGRWEDVAELRRLMKERGVNKTPGSSFIDLRGSVHEFIAGDKIHPRRREIYAMVDEMGRKLRAAGYRPNTDQVLIDMHEEEKGTALFHHSEKLALAFGLICSDPGSVIRITKNLRVCDDCHEVMKLVSRIYKREIVVRDRCRFHHFRDGACSCKDYW
ncbi:Pentatricopeptide repeat-containing protein [Ananas comosus]|uniref:Pentatricopeptide repeat-containing protein n=1 Tax=Ananas comosus TaxID=4615 RepID=A0A199UMX1_ANACO|nr:Pentatricopeptide repeat-containing protein [Ananas comosus]